VGGGLFTNKDWARGGWCYKAGGGDAAVVHSLKKNNKGEINRRDHKSPKDIGKESVSSCVGEGGGSTCGGELQVQGGVVQQWVDFGQITVGISSEDEARGKKLHETMGIINLPGGAVGVRGSGGQYNGIATWWVDRGSRWY